VTTSSKWIGFIGLGVMGGRMARRLIEHGHQLIVHDINAAALRTFVKLGARARREVRAKSRTVHERC